MNSTTSLAYGRNFRRFIDRVNALSCIRFLIALEIAMKFIKIISITVILFIKWNEECIVPLKLFLGVYAVFNLLKAFAFYFKNRSFFFIRRIPEYEENTDIGLINNLLEALMLFWYIIGFHWIQECEFCKTTNTFLYYTCLIWIYFGFFTFIAPLLAIVLLLIIVAYIRPKLKVVSYNNISDIPDNNNKCTICFDEYREGVEIKFLPCNHHFHSECIDEWFNIKDSCPLCKKHVNVLYDLVDTADPII